MSTQQHQQQQQQQQQQSSTFGSSTTTATAPDDTDLAARLAAPVSPTTEKSAAEAQRRTSEWKPPAPLAQRAFSFDEQEHKRAMMAASGTLSGTGPGVAAREQGFSECG